ncbi:MAG: tetratricopeptide repeat protein [Candidatus Omnitrophica bacterium]|nr:tetratricopeptide repeat protein [Candidatus Omnitrophota bacterium]
MVLSKRKPLLLAFLSALTLVSLLGCFSSRKPESQKDLVKLSLDTQEEARKLRDAGNLESAVVKYQEAMRYHTSPSLHQELGGVLVDLGRYSEARKQYELALVENPGMREAEVAMEQLDARIELAEADRLAPKGESGSSRGESFDMARAPSGERGPGDQFDFMDEEAAFREMREYTPDNAGERPRSGQTGEGSELARDAQSLFGVGEDNLELEYNADAGSGAGAGLESEVYSEAPTFEPETTAMKSRPIAPTASAFGGKKPLPGGRGLIQGRGLVSQVVASGPPMNPPARPDYDLDNDLGFEGTEKQLYDEAPVIEPVASLPKSGPVTPRGGRGLGGERRLPSVKQADSLDVEDPKVGTYIPVAPKASLPSEDELAYSGGLNRNPDLPPKESGFLSDDPIVYPTPKPSLAAGAEKPLPAPGFEKEVLDLSGSSFSDRFKGRRVESLDLESCKRRYYEEGDLEGAIRCFRDKRIDFPESSELHYELGKIYESSGQFPLAREEYLLALRYSPNNQQYQETLASVEVSEARQLIDDGKYLPATEILIKTVDRFPNMSPAYRELGKAYSKSALNRQQELDATGIPAPEVDRAIATEWRRAEASYRKLLDLTGGTDKDWYNYGVAIQSQYDPAKDRTAINAYEKSLELDPNFWDAHYNVAILYETKSPQKSIYHYEEALSLARNETGPEGKSHRIQCLSALGELYWRTNQTDKAADYLTEYMRLVPDDAHIEQILEQITSAPAIRD